MRCGRLSVEGEAEEYAVSPKPRSRQRHGKRSNPYSMRGLDKFKIVYAELSARREYIAKKTGAPEALVRFVYSKNRWIPVVVRAREGVGKKNGGEGAAGVSILGPVVKTNGQKDGELRKKDAENRINSLSERTLMPVLNERNHSLPILGSRIFRITAFGVLGLSVMWVKRSAAAIAVVMAVGGVMVMKKFIVSGVSSFATLFRNLKSSQNGGGFEAIAEQKDIDKFSRRTPKRDLPVSAPCSPVRAHVQRTQSSSTASLRTVKSKIIKSELKRLHHQSKAKKFRRFVSLDNRPTRPARLEGSDSFYRRTRPAVKYNVCMDATAMIIALLCLVFFGRLCAIFFTSACWHLLPMLGEHSDDSTGMDTNNNSRIVDLQSSENRKKAMRDGLVRRKPNG